MSAFFAWFLPLAIETIHRLPWEFWLLLPVLDILAVVKIGKWLKKRFGSQMIDPIANRATGDSPGPRRLRPGLDLEEAP